MVVKIVPNDKANPPGKLAEAELHFTDGVFGGLKLSVRDLGTTKRQRAQRHVPFAPVPVVAIVAALRCASRR